MLSNLVCIPLILKTLPNDDIRKNDSQQLQILVNSNKELIKIPVSNINLKENIKEEINKIINTSNFHLEQVYTLGEDEYITDGKIDIIYLAVTNIENIKDLKEEYQLIDIDIHNNLIKLDKETYQFKTKEKINNNNIEYYHKINVEDVEEKKKVLEILIAYKHLRNKLDNSDILFKFLPKYFTLEETRTLYEKLKETTTDKSNFRKKIIKYCKETSKNTDKKGFRPSKLYTFKVLKGDIWL